MAAPMPWHNRITLACIAIPLVSSLAHLSGVNILSLHIRTFRSNSWPQKVTSRRKSRPQNHAQVQRSNATLLYDSMPSMKTWPKSKAIPFPSKSCCDGAILQDGMEVPRSSIGMFMLHDSALDEHATESQLKGFPCRCLSNS